LQGELDWNRARHVSSWKIGKVKVMGADVKETSGFPLNKMFSEDLGQIFSFSRPLYTMDTRS
jgi:hypothetical protein